MIYGVERDCVDLINWAQSMPASQINKDYLIVAVVIQSEIEPIIRETERKIVMEGNVISPEITQSTGFIRDLKIAHSRLDPDFLPLLHSNETPLTESIALTKTKEKVIKLSKVILLISRIDKDKSILEIFCNTATQEINRIINSIEGPFRVSTQALISEAPCRPNLTFSSGSVEPRLIENSIEGDEHSVFPLESREGVLLEKHFYHGESEKIDAKLTIGLERDEIVIRENKNIVKSEFSDLRKESETRFFLREELNGENES